MEFWQGKDCVFEELGEDYSETCIWTFGLIHFIV